MIDTDWRPSLCPKCGTLRPAARHPKCPICDNPKNIGDQDQKYLLINSETEELKITSNLIDNPEYPNLKDYRIFKIGPEVVVKVTVEIVPSKPVTRG